MRPPFTTTADVPGAAIAFRLSQTHDPDGVVTSRIFLAGELSLTTADLAHAAIHCAQREARDLICDLEDIVFIDVCGVCALLDLANRADAAGGSLEVTNPPPMVPRVLRILGLEHGLKLDTSALGARRVSTAPTRAEACNATVRSHRTAPAGAGRRVYRRFRPLS